MGEASSNAAAKPAAADKQENIIETFMIGARKGFNVGINNILPAMVLGYVLVQALQVSGLMTILSKVCKPVMAIFGLPGEAVTVLISAFFAKAAGAATAFSLFSAGKITAAQATILLMPCMLMGTLIGHYARIVLVSGCNKKHTALMFAVPIIDSVIGMLLVKFLLQVMGLM